MLGAGAGAERGVWGGEEGQGNKAGHHSIFVRNGETKTRNIC